MKKGWMLLFVILLCATSCDDKFGYTHLDGMWQMVRIEYADGEIETPKDTYFSFQMSIIEMKGHGTFSGSFRYEDGLMPIDMGAASGDQLKPFGVNDPQQVFIVEKLNSDKLILRSDYARLELRKY